ncbi:MAG: dockerin type I repeat-containing protein [Firmicutes bacterium]|nr:dockerin type I repeat-containing protein [Bacillota bacterium]
MEFINVTSYCFQDKTYEYTLKIKNKAFGKWDLGKTVIYINGVSIKDLGKYATCTEYSSATDPEDCGVYGNIVFNKLDYNNIFCEEPEDQVAWEGQTQFDVSWRTIFKPVKVEIWNNGEIKETITDIGFSSSQLSTLNYTMTHTLERSPYLYTVRAYYGNGGTDYIDSREFLLSYHKALLLSQPKDTMIPSGESGVPLGWEVNFTPVKVDFYKNGDKVDTLTDSSIKYYMFTEGKWYLAIYESERYLSRPAVLVETDEFVVSKYAKPVITSQPTAETVPYIGGGTNVKIEADNAYSYLWMLKDEKGYIYSWSSASELGWCDMVGTSYKSDTLVLENVSEEMAKKNIYCIVYDQGGNISVTSDWIKLDVAKKLNSVSVTIPGLEKLCAGDFVDDYRNVVVNTEHCTEGTAVWSSASSVFKEGENAFVFVLVNCEEGYTFTDSPDCYINEEKVNLTNRQDGYVSFNKKITVPEAEYLKGDINNNGYVDDTDAALLLKHIGVKNILSDEQIEKAELTNDGKLDMLDVIWILNHKTTA